MLNNKKKVEKMTDTRLKEIFDRKEYLTLRTEIDEIMFDILTPKQYAFWSPENNMEQVFKLLVERRDFWPAEAELTKENVKKAIDELDGILND